MTHTILSFTACAVFVTVMIAVIEFVREDDPRALNLDFYLPEYDIHIECKRFHSPRISGQMARTTNIIVIQGIEAARVFAKMLAGFRLVKAEPYIKRFDQLPPYGPQLMED